MGNILAHHLRFGLDVFVNLASTRFLLWVDSSQDYLPNAIVSKDILVVWYASMLNPEAYYHFRKHKSFANSDTELHLANLKSDLL